MGDPKFSRAHFERPSHPWEAERIKTENELLKKYGLKNKKELWRSQYTLRRFRQRARELQALVRTGNKQAEKEREQLLRRLDEALHEGGPQPLPGQPEHGPLAALGDGHVVPRARLVAARQPLQVRRRQAVQRGDPDPGHVTPPPRSP